jgi:NAD(P)H-dependent FMN reductase
LSSARPESLTQIPNFVADTINSTYQPDSVEPSLHFIDLQERNLPFFNESDVPSQVTDHSKYDHAHTRAWSEEVQSYDAFIFVTPQYNWGHPAVLKNAIDYLYHECEGKSAMIVSYGGDGGGKCDAQLRQVLCAVNMIPTKNNVELSFPSRDFYRQCGEGEGVESRCHEHIEQCGLGFRAQEHR